MRQIELTQGQYAIIDDEDYDRVSKLSWHAYFNKKVNSFYALHNNYDNGKHSTIYMHRFITGALAGEKVDHKNHDTLNNQKENLRRCSDANSVANRRGHKNSTSHYKGVRWEEDRKKWAAQITKDYKGIFLGYFIQEKRAAIAYDKKARELFGEYAFLNFPEIQNYDNMDW